MEKYFKLKERGTDVKTEFIAGLTTFMAMAYILMVNAGMFSNPFGDGTDVLGVSFGAMYISTALSAVIGTVLIGLLANLPLAQAPGMGLNAFFVYTVCVGLGLSYSNALVLVLADGIIFIILTITGLRKLIFKAIPDAVRKAIPAGVGLFIAFIGLQNAGIVVADGATKVKMGSMNLYSGISGFDESGAPIPVVWGDIMPMLITIFAVVLIAVLTYKGIKGSVLFGIFGGTAAYYLLGFTVPGFYDGFASTIGLNPLAAFSDFSTQALGRVFIDGFNFTPFIESHGMTGFIIMFITTALSFCMVDMFDTLGTLYGACARGNLLTEDGEVPKMNHAMLADAIATTSGSILGTSTVTTFVESSAGVVAGGKTGLASMFTAMFFAISMFLSPLAQLIPTYATAAALIYVGVLMMNSVLDIQWNKVEVAVPAFFTLAMMSFTYNISFGIGFGILSWVFITLFSGESKKISVTTWIVAVLFALTFLLTH